MADPVTGTLAGISALGSLAGGISQANALRSEAAGLEYQSQYTDLRADQMALNRRQQFGEALAAMRVDRAARNLGGDSAASLQQTSVARKRESADENAVILGEKVEGTRLRHLAASRRRAAPFAVIGGVTGAARSLAGALG